ncbi:MAG: thermonuclease family protein [Thermomicrobiales bacterium]
MKKAFGIGCGGMALLLGCLIVATIAVSLSGGKATTTANAKTPATAAHLTPAQTHAAELARLATTSTPIATRAATSTPPPPTATVVPPTQTPVPPTATPIPPTPVPTATATPAPPAREAVTVIDVLDGATIKVKHANDVVDLVAYLGIDVPHADECYGNAATQHNTELVAGRTLQLEQDTQDRGPDGRLLRYVWVTGDDGATRHANEEMVKFGFATTVRQAPNAHYQAALDNDQTSAKVQQLGLWSACASVHQALPTPTPAPTATPTPVPAPRQPQGRYWHGAPLYPGAVLYRDVDANTSVYAVADNAYNVDRWFAATWTAYGMYFVSDYVYDKYTYHLYAYGGAVYGYTVYQAANGFTALGLLVVNP